MSLLVDAIPGVGWIRGLRPSRPEARSGNPPALAPYRRQIERLLDHLVATPGPAVGWPLELAAIRRLLATDRGIVTALVTFGAEPGKAVVVKLATQPLAATSLDRHYQVIDHLRTDPDLRSFWGVVPEPLEQGQFEGRGYVLEGALLGLPGRWFLWNPDSLAWIQRRGAEQIAWLHEATLRPRRIDADQFERLGGLALRSLDATAAAWADGPRLRRRLGELRAELEGALICRDLGLTWIHGDFWPGNLIVDWHRGSVSGIVDWDRAAPDELPLHDLFHLLLQPAVVSRRGLGEVVVDQLLGGKLDPAQRRLATDLIERLDLPADPGFFRAAALLYWLRTVAGELSRHPERQHDPRWLGRNVWPVLEARRLPSLGAQASNLPGRSLTPTR